jgi:glycopeptide antibiotics resistance protein
LPSWKAAREETGCPKAKDRSFGARVLDFERGSGTAKLRLMRNKRTDPHPQTPVYAWSNRILIAALAGILFLTLYPFRFAGATKLFAGASPFLLGTAGKSPSLFDNFLNVLLFIPFGFGLSASLRQRGKSLKATFFLSFIVGALLSYGIEFVQLYIPARDSGWDDVFTNTAGSVLGFFAFALCGKLATRILSKCEFALESWLAPRQFAAILFIYFGLWFAVSVSLQKETQLTNWEQGTRLLVGNEASGRQAYSWKGEVFQLQLWDRALPDEDAKKLTAGEMPVRAQTGLLGDYEFSGKPPFQDLQKSLPELSWTPNAPDRPDSNSVFLDGKFWLDSRVPVTALVTDLQETKQFSVRVVCVPAEVEGAEGRIVSISQASGVVNLNLRQEDANLVFWFRNPLSVKRSTLAWYTPGVFKAGQVRDILFSYDGSNLSLFIDGVKGPRVFSLGPGTGLARLLRRVKSSELEGYNYVYLVLVFLPGGILLGIAGRRLHLRSPATSLLMAVGFLFPALVLEKILVTVSGRPASAENIALSLCLAIAGSIWVNADRRTPVLTD